MQEAAVPGRDSARWTPLLASPLDEAPHVSRDQLACLYSDSSRLPPPGDTRHCGGTLSKDTRVWEGAEGLTWDLVAGREAFLLHFAAGMQGTGFRGPPARLQPSRPPPLA